MFRLFPRVAALSAAILLFAVAMSAACMAADLPGAITKAPAYANYPTGSGWFYGVSGSGLGGTAAANGTQGGTVFGGRFGIDGGYTGNVAGTFYFIEASASVQAINGASSSLALLSAVNFEERFAIGVPQSVWQKVAGVIPGLSSVSMPSVPVIGDGTLGPANPYVFAALYQDDVSASIGAQSGKAWLMSYGAGVGFLNRASNGIMLDTSVEWKHGAAGMLVGSSLVYPFQDAYLATVRLKF